MKIFIQGMRRSGTTVLYDLFCQEGSFDCFYEPFGPAKRDSLGGGSGLQQHNLAAKTRAVRERFCAAGGEVTDPDFFNYGAPRDAGLELETQLPKPCLEYLRMMTSGADRVVLKFVRMASKVADLRALDAESRLIHIVRDPRRVAVSQIYGRSAGQRTIGKRKLFKRRKAGGFLWASRELSELLVARPEYAHLSDLSDVERVLLVWGFLFRQTHDAAREHFGDDQLLIRHEDLVSRPASEIEGLFAFVGAPAHPSLVDWAEKHFRPPTPPVFPEASQWRDAARRVGIEEALLAAGYGEVLAARRSWISLRRIGEERMGGAGR